MAGDESAFLHDFGDKMEAHELESQKDCVRAEIRKEMRIKDGAERLVKAAKSVKYSHKREAASMLKGCHERISTLREQLESLNSKVADHIDGRSLSSLGNIVI